MSKHLNKKRSIGSCPNCRGVIFRDLKNNKTLDSILFKVRCPHCMEDTLIEIRKGKIVIREDKTK